MDILSLWSRFWHEPVRAERLALSRILFGLAVLTDALFQYWPHFEEFFGPTGTAPAGTHDRYQLGKWYWPMLFFGTDNRSVLDTLFLIWVTATFLFILGWHTRVMNVLVWFLTMVFQVRNPAILNGGDDTIMVGLFLLMLSPSGRALSLDAIRRRRKAPPHEKDAEPLIPPWSVRVMQIQLCMIYLGTGLPKLQGTTWWDGTSIHYVLNYTTMSRWSFAQLPLPFWLTKTMTYVSVWWEVLFTVLVIDRWTRKWALWFGVCFHLGIYFSIEVGWFSFYTLSFYGVWVSDAFWRWLWSESRCAGRASVRRN